MYSCLNAPPKPAMYCNLDRLLSGCLKARAPQPPRVALMIESNLKAGNQSIPANLDELEYGVSVTDGCIGWDSTEACLRQMRDMLRDVLPGRV